MASWTYLRRIGVQLAREKSHLLTATSQARKPILPVTVIWKEVASPSQLSTRHFTLTSYNSLRCPSLLSSQQQQPQKQEPQAVIQENTNEAQKTQDTTDDRDYLDMSPEEINKLSYLQRFKKMGKQYSVVLIPFHIATSFMWYGSFYFASKSGVDLLPVLEWIGVGESVKLKLTTSNASHYILAYALYKVITPARYITTIGGTSLIVRQLRRRGWMQHHPQEQTLKEATREMTDKAKVRVKDKATEMKDRTAGAVKDRAEGMRGALKDKAQEVREKATTNAKEITQKFRKK